MTVKDRFAEPDYDGEYDDIDTVFTSEDPDEVNRMEADLIEAFKGYANCDKVRTTD